MIPALPLTPSGSPPLDSRAERCVTVAAAWVGEGRRLDMQGVADELGVSRVTLHRYVGTRERLLGEALWVLTERVLRASARRWERQRPPGGLLSPGTGQLVNAAVSRSSALRRLLDTEPGLAVRVLTDPHGPVQPRVVAFVEDLLRRDVEQGLVLSVDPPDLALALVRLGESFLYADVLAARRPDVATADRLQAALLQAARA